MGGDETFSLTNTQYRNVPAKKVFECVVNVKVMPSIQLYMLSTMSMSIVHSNNLLQAVICQLAPLATWLERSAGVLGVKVSNPCQLFIFPQIVSHVNVKVKYNDNISEL